MELLTKIFIIAGLIPSGYFDLPHDSNGWQSSGWSFNSKVHILEASNETLPKKCKKNQTMYIIFPSLIHGNQEIYVDNILYSRIGDTKNDIVYSTVTYPFVPCEALKDAKIIKWKISSYAKSLAKIQYFPKLTEEEPKIGEYSHTIRVSGVFVLIMIFFLSLLFFRGKISNEKLFWFLSTIFGATTFCAFSVPYSLGIAVSMHFCQQVSDVFLIICMVSWIQISCIHGYINKVHANLLGILLVSVDFCLFLGETLDISQAFMDIALFIFGLYLIYEFFVILVQIYKNFTWEDLFSLCSAIVFLGTYFSEVANQFLWIETVRTAPLALVGFTWFHGLRFEKEISSQLTQRQIFLEQMNKFRNQNVELIRQLALNKGASDAINKVFHDIRYPFLALKTILEQVKKGNLDETKIKKFTADLENKIEYVDNIIANILQNSKNINFEMKSLDAKEAVDKILQLSFTHFKKDIRLDIPQIKVLGNEDKLQRIMLNLISNALEANPKNPNIFIAAIIQGEKVIFEVRNQGSFIDDGKKNQIFNLYFTSGKENGTGLGLALCKELVSSMGGDIWCESDRETETTAFFFSLPVAS